MRQDEHGGWAHRGPDPLTPGRVPVYGHTPMDWLANYGAPPTPEPDPAVDREHYASPGPPPWDSQVHQDLAVQHGWKAPGEKRRGLPAWAWVSIVLGGLLIVCGAATAVSFVGESGPVPAVSTVPSTSPVAVSGTCQKRIVGQYGLVATVRATNATDEPQKGVLWVRWEVTGETAQEFVKPTTIAPRRAVELPVNQEVPAERWFRIGSCSYGWTAQ